MFRRLLGVLVALAVVMTPTAALLHTHGHAAGRAGTVVDVSHLPDHASGDARPDGHDRDPAGDDQDSCGFCFLVHQARAELGTSVPVPPAPTLARARPDHRPETAPRVLTTLCDAPPRGPPAL
ncbi:MAG: DUF2946 domain-containing protein [Leptolyngbya sp. PLA1]|nr:DUF2946 domain-containing protein [Leptolyngbya sp. PLA1]